MGALTRHEERAVENARRKLAEAETVLRKRMERISDEQDCARLLVEQGADYEREGERLCLDGGYSATIKAQPLFITAVARPIFPPDQFGRGKLRGWSWRG